MHLLSNIQRLRKCVANLPVDSMHPLPDCSDGRMHSYNAASRMRQFVEPRDWRAHVEEHISALDKHVSEHEGPHPLLRCPHPRPQCGEETFDSVQRLAFHLRQLRPFHI
jgi:hypothetical protein